MYKKTKESMKMTIFYDAFLILTYSDPSFANKLPSKSSISLKKLLTFWRSLFGEVNPGTLSHQGWTKNPVYPAPSQTSKNEVSAKVVNGLEPLTTFAKSSMSDTQLESEYASGLATAAHELKNIQWNILIHVPQQLFIENIIPNFEKPPTKDMRNKRIPSKNLTA